MVPPAATWLAWLAMPSVATETTTLPVAGLQVSALTAGPADGEPVVLLHGFPDTNRTWSGQVAALSDAGFRCIAPMLRGYEPSSQPDPHAPVTTYSPVRAADDLVEIARNLGAPVRGRPRLGLGRRAARHRDGTGRVHDGHRRRGGALARAPPAFCGHRGSS